jgi:hypothetical protein
MPAQMTEIVFSSPKVMDLKETLAYMGDDEIVEEALGSMRLRKKDRRWRSEGKQQRPRIEERTIVSFSFSFYWHMVLMSDETDIGLEPSEFRS